MQGCSARQTREAGHAAKRPPLATNLWRSCIGWATTSSSPDDVWLGAGEEHTVQSPGLTVIESVDHSTVELIPPTKTGTRGHIMNRYEITIPRAVCNVAAIAMTAVTIGLLVVLPAKLGPGSQEARSRLASNVVATTPTPIER